MDGTGKIRDIADRIRVQNIREWDDVDIAEATVRLLQTHMAVQLLERSSLYQKVELEEKHLTMAMGIGIPAKRGRGRPVKEKLTRGQRSLHQYFSQR